MVSGHIIRECFIYWSRLLALLLHTFYKAPGLHPKALSVYLIWTILCLLVRNFLLFLLAARTCHADYESLINSFLIQNLFCCLESERRKRDTSYTKCQKNQFCPGQRTITPVYLCEETRLRHILQMVDHHWQNISHVITSSWFIRHLYSLLYLL